MISQLTNSEIGSAHWFNTLVGQIKRTGEFLAKPGNIEKAGKDTIELWGENIKEACDELIEWREQDYEQTVNSRVKGKLEQLIRNM